MMTEIHTEEGDQKHDFSLEGPTFIKNYSHILKFNSSKNYFCKKSFILYPRIKIQKSQSYNDFNW